MITYLLVAGFGLVFLLVSLVVRVLLDEIRIGRVGISGPAIGNAAVVFGLVGAVAIVNDTSTGVTNGTAAAAALTAAVLTQVAVDRLAVRSGEPAHDDGAARSGEPGASDEPAHDGEPAAEREARP